MEQKLKKEHDELSKIDTGIAKVFLQDREKDRENLRHKAANVDPRNASRTPSAAREPAYRLRYESPVGACKLNPRLSSLKMYYSIKNNYEYYSVPRNYSLLAPSRNIDHARPWEDEDGISFRSSGPSYNGEYP